ncbi:hypothetical protein TBK1r_19360 [Stieleria magnilauensis]|uniref:Glycosyltransferase subfamily 4-like N-terminal domain-containing protein n=1 Tax=Stieleria magnilauensis TaxID=2527963 RepID=A0ABX5XLZ3_9BACT|nr:hypothetical protein TBK1r_19360 [Planctomycetes bacterium TBK1r]
MGQVYLRDLVETISDQQLHVYALLKEDCGWREGDRQSVEGYTLLERRYEYPYGVGPGRLNGLVATAAFELMTVRHARRLGNTIADSILSTGFDAVLVVLESPLLMFIGRRLCKVLNCPVHILVWDHPNHVCTAFGHEGFRKRRLLAAFSSVLSQAASALTVSKTLRNWMAKSNSDLPIRLFRSPARPRQTDSTVERDAEKQAFVLGFAGSVTAPDELEVLQRSLDHLKWKIDDRPIVLRLYGKRFTLSASDTRNVQYRGFLPTQADVVTELAECDVCFLPQPFAPSGRLVAEYSFPTKVSSYLSAGRPLLVLAPPHASLSTYQSQSKDQGDPRYKLENESPFGFCCETSDPVDLADLIRRMVRDHDFYQRGCGRASSCANASFRGDAGASNVREALGIATTATPTSSQLC